MKQHKFKIVTPSYNNIDWVEYNVASVLNQTYQNYEVLYIDDNSTDGTYDKVLSIVKDDPRWKVIRRTENKWATYNYFFADAIDFLEDDDDIIIHLDGDDWLFDNNVLENLNKFYVEKDVWMTYGKMYCFTGSDEVVEANPQNTPYSDYVIKNKLFRKDMWRASHMRTYKTFLFKKFDTQDLYSKIDGKLFWHAGDLAFQFPYLEMCPEGKIGVLDFPSYIYNQAPKNQERTKEREHSDHFVYEEEIRNRPIYKELPLTI
jgi:glycosyltransferase involved in cell wall biosynthesis